MARIALVLLVLLLAGCTAPATHVRPATTAPLGPVAADSTNLGFIIGSSTEPCPDDDFPRRAGYDCIEFHWSAWNKGNAPVDTMARHVADAAHDFLHRLGAVAKVGQAPRFQIHQVQAHGFPGWARVIWAPLGRVKPLQREPPPCTVGT